MAYRLCCLWDSDAIPRAHEIGLDAAVVGTTLAVSLAIGLMFGILPALGYNASWLAAALSESGRANTASRGRFRLRSALVVAQVALALVLLVGSGLMVRSYASARRRGPRVRPVIDPSRSNSRSSPMTIPVKKSRRGLFSERLTHFPSCPASRTWPAASGLPLSRSATGQGFVIEDTPLGEGELPPVYAFKHVSPNYFETMRIPLVAGRTFERTRPRRAAEHHHY